MDFSLTTTAAAVALTTTAAVALSLMQRPAPKLTEEYLVSENNNTKKNKRPEAPKSAVDKTVSLSVDTLADKAKSAKKAKADKKKKQKAKKASSKKQLASDMLSTPSTPQKPLALAVNDADSATAPEEGWDVVVAKRPKQSTISPSVAALLRRESLEVEKLPLTSKVLAVTATTATSKAAPEPSHSSEVKVSAAKLGHIIGPAGQTIKAIQELTGCSIDIPDREGAMGASITVTATGADTKQLQTAKRIIADLCSKGYSSNLESALSGGDFNEGMVKVPIGQVHEIIGKGGATIQLIQKTLGVKLNIPDTTSAGKKKNIKVTIAGPKKAVQEAKDVVKSLVHHHYHQLTHPGTTHIEVEVPPSMYNIVIGPRGSAIKHIQNSYSVKVHIPGDESDTDNVVVVGSTGRVKQAKKHILSMVERAYAEQEAQQDWNTSGDQEQHEHERYEPWMDDYMAPRRTAAAQWA